MPPPRPPEKSRQTILDLKFLMTQAQIMILVFAFSLLKLKSCSLKHSGTALCALTVFFRAKNLDSCSTSTEWCLKFVASEDDNQDQIFLSFNES